MHLFCLNDCQDETAELLGTCHSKFYFRDICGAAIASDLDMCHVSGPDAFPIPTRMYSHVCHVFAYFRDSLLPPRTTARLRGARRP